MRHGLAITTVIFTLTASAVQGQLPAPSNEDWTASRSTAPAWSQTQAPATQAASQPATSDPWSTTAKPDSRPVTQVEHAQFEPTRGTVQPAAWAEPVQAPPSTIGTGGDSFIPPIVMPSPITPAPETADHSEQGSATAGEMPSFPPMSAYSTPPSQAASRRVPPAEYPRLEAPTGTPSDFVVEERPPARRELSSRVPRKTYPELHKIWQSPTGDAYSDPLLAPPTNHDRARTVSAEIPAQRPSLGNLAPPLMPQESSVQERNQRNLHRSPPLTTAAAPPALAEIPSHPPVVRTPSSVGVRTTSSELADSQIAAPTLDLPPRQIPVHAPAPAPASTLHPLPELEPPAAAQATPSALFAGKPYALPAAEPCQRWGCKLFGCKHCKPHARHVVGQTFGDAACAPDPFCDDIACDYVPGGLDGCSPLNCAVFEPWGSGGLWVGNERVIRQGNVVVPFIQDEDSVGLLDFQGEWDDRDAGEFHLGLGYRTFLDPYWIFGASIYYDLIATEHSNVFHQGRIGVELLTLNWDFRIAGIYPATDGEGTTATSGISNGTVVTRNSEERAYAGVEAEVGHRFLNWGWNDCFEARWYVGGYYFENSAQGFPSFGGPRGRLELRMYDLGWFGEQSRLELGLETMYDRVRDGQIAATMQLRIPFGARQTRDALSPMRRRLIDPLRHDVQ